MHGKTVLLYISWIITGMSIIIMEISCKSSNKEIEIRNKMVPFSQSYSWCYKTKFINECHLKSDPIACTQSSRKCYKQKSELIYNGIGYRKQEVEYLVSIDLECPIETHKIHLIDIRYMIPGNWDKFCSAIQGKQCEPKARSNCSYHDCLGNDNIEHSALVSQSTTPPSKWIDECLNTTNGTCKLSVPRKRIDDNPVSYDCVADSNAGFSYCYSRWVQITYLCADYDEDGVVSSDMPKTPLVTVSNQNYEVRTKLTSLEKDEENNTKLILVIFLGTVALMLLIVSLILLVMYIKLRRQTQSKTTHGNTVNKSTVIEENVRRPGNTSIRKTGSSEVTSADEVTNGSETSNRISEESVPLNVNTAAGYEEISPPSQEEKFAPTDKVTNQSQLPTDLSDERVPLNNNTAAPYEEVLPPKSKKKLEEGKGGYYNVADGTEREKVYEGLKERKEHDYGNVNKIYQPLY